MIIMNIRKFIDRKVEMNSLEAIFKRKGFKLYPLYGRRRIGKTALLKEFLSKHNGLYFLCTSEGLDKNSKLFSRSLSVNLGIPPMDAPDFRTAFQFAVQAELKDGIIALDEFPALAQSDEGVLGEFQYIVDEVLSKTDVMLVLCGSSIGMMENYVLSKKSPLFGRRTGQMSLGPIRYKDIPDFLTGYSFKDTIEVQGIAGGIPRYLIEFSEHDNIKDTLTRSVFSNDGYLYREAYILLHDELRDPDRYMGILESMAAGNARITDIANTIHIPAKDLPKYLNVLERLGIVSRIRPVTETRPNAKNSLYFIADSYFRFWFRFVYPHRGSIEYQQPDVPLRDYEEKKNEFLGSFFESYIADLIRDLNEGYTVGKWWHKGEEIDVVALGPNGKMLMCEVKWQNMPMGYDVAEDLVRKSQYVPGANKRKPDYLVVSRSGFTPSALERMDAEGIMHWSLSDVERLVEKNRTK